MVTVAVTGAGGLIGRRLVAELDGDEDITRLVGIDIAEPSGLAARRFEFRRADIRDADFARHLRDVDVLVHLAFQFDPIQDEELMREINVRGTRNVFESAVAAGVRKVVYPSSSVVYGAHPDNDFPLTENSPLRANPDFNYAEHKLAIEEWLWPWLEDRDDLLVTVLRPAIVAGPGVQNFISRQLEQPRMTAIKGHRPPLQFVHVDDVASAIAHVVRNDLPGAYNVTSEGWLSYDEVSAIGGRKVTEVPEEVAFTMAERLWNLGLGEAPPGEVHYFMHPWVMSADKLIATGWRPKHSNRDALAELVEEHRDWVTFAGVRARRSNLRAGAFAVVLAAVSALLWRVLRRR